MEDLAEEYAQAIKILKQNLKKHKLELKTTQGFEFRRKLKKRIAEYEYILAEKVLEYNYILNYYNKDYNGRF